MQAPALVPEPPSIERFAQLCAALDDGFAPRADVLAAAGLDEIGWRRVRAEWLLRLGLREAPELVQRFRGAYAHARSQGPGHAAPRGLEGTSPGGAPAGPDEHDTDVGSPPSPSATEEPDQTAAFAFPLAGPAIPFRVTPPWLLAAEQAASSAAAPLSMPSQHQRQAAAPADPAEETLEIQCLVQPPHAALPFDGQSPRSAQDSAPTDTSPLTSFTDNEPTAR